MAGASRMSIHAACGPTLSHCPGLLKDFPSGGFSGLSMPSPCRCQLQGHLLPPLARPREAHWGTLQPGFGAADYSSGCRGKGSPVEEEKVRGWGLWKPSSLGSLGPVLEMLPQPCTCPQLMVCKAPPSHGAQIFWRRVSKVGNTQLQPPECLSSISFPAHPIVKDWELTGDQ